MGARYWIPTILLLLLVTTSCSNLGGGGNNADDGNSPFMILDLRASAVTDSSITLKWTATGDDSSAGTASLYDMRMLKLEITNANWDSATQLSGEPSPSPAGQTDSMVVRGLMADSTYYFALNACDEAGNCSGRSNCVSASCFMDYIITFPDTGLQAAVRRQINRPTGVIHRIDIMNMTFLDANGAGIESLIGLEHCTNLMVIYMSGNPLVSDLTPLAGLRKLNGLQFSNGNITDITPMDSLANLEGISLRGNPVADISTLSHLLNLHLMELSQTHITDLSPLVTNSGITYPDTIWLYNNPQLSDQSVNHDIPELTNRGVTILR
jgi:Leucine-rich repeat (LRR) protein